MTDSRSLTRRQLLRVGGIGMLGLSLPEFLQARDRGPSGMSRGPEKSCIFIVQYGGASQLDTFDLKPLAPKEIRGPYKPISTSVPGIQICEMLPRLAGLSHRYAVIRSMTHKTSDHDGGMHVCMTGSSQPKESTPYFGSVVAKARPSIQNVPSYVWLQDLDVDVKPWYLNGGILGAAYAPLLVGKRLDNPSNPKFRMTALDLPADVPNSRMMNRRNLLGELDHESADLSSRRTAPGRSLAHYQERAVNLVTGSEARRAFNLELEGPRVRENYGLNPLGQNLLLARRLVEAGVRLVSVNAWAGYVPDTKFLVTQGWDMHGAAVQGCGIFSNGTFGLGFVLPRFDQAVSALLEDLDQRGLLETTLVVIVGEFGRTPKIANAPYAGRDHWPACYSAILAGAGVKGGMVYGASDKIGAYVKDKPISPEDFGATLYHSLGIPPEFRISPDGFTPASTGQAVAELLS